MYRELKDALLSIAEKAIDALEEDRALIQLRILRHHLEHAIEKAEGKRKEATQ